MDVQVLALMFLSYDNKPEANATAILISITFYHENDVVFLQLFLIFKTFSLSNSTWIANIEAIINSRVNKQESTTVFLVMEASLET